MQNDWNRSMTNSSVSRTRYLLAGLAQAWKCRPFLVLSLLAALAVLSLFVEVETPDWARFNDEALSMLAGQGYRTMGQLETSLPPGYPLLIATMKLLGASDWNVVALQAVLFVAACNLIYFSMHGYSRQAAIIGMGALAIHPLAVRLTGYYLSETLGLFLCASLIFLYSRIERNRAKEATVLLFGAVAVFLPLTSPALIITSFLLFALATVKLLHRRAFLVAASGIAGALVIMTPWQLHCVRSTGNICPVLFSTTQVSRLLESQPSQAASDPFLLWFRTWSWGERDMPVLHKLDIKSAPARAFDSEAERTALIETASPIPRTVSPKQAVMLASIAEKRRAEDPLKQYVELPAERAYNLWFDMNQIGHAQMEYVGQVFPGSLLRDMSTIGLPRALLRCLKGVLSTLVYGLYIAYPLFALAMLYFGLRTRNVEVLLIVASVLAYTLITGYSALCESRRNVVFLPAILFLFSFLPARILTRWWPRRNERAAIESSGTSDTSERTHGLRPL
jgi:hypothetical protein